MALGYLAPKNHIKPDDLRFFDVLSSYPNILSKKLDFFGIVLYYNINT